MKIATGIISLVLMLIVGVQSCAVGVGGSIINKSDMQQGGAVGLLVTFLYLLGGAFAFGLPVVSMIIFALGGLLAIAVAATTSYTDMYVWGVISFMLGVMSFFAWRNDRKKKQTANTSTDVQA